jgi:hypothetical protein
MIKNWYNCKVKYMKIDDLGNESLTTETYCLDAVSYSEAEARLYQEMERRGRGAFKVMNISKSNYNEVINAEEIVEWYKVKVVGVEYDEETGKEKNYNNFYLVTADSCKTAIDRTEEAMSDFGMEYIIQSVAYVNIEDVFPFDEDNVVINEEAPEEE